MKIGDKVICIKSHEFGITRKGEEYIVRNTVCCPGCGNASLDLGISDLFGVITTCCVCGSGIGNSNVWYQDIKRFRKIEPHTFTNQVTKELSKAPLVKETLEIVPQKELV